MGFDLVSRLLFPTPPASYNVDSFEEELIFVPKTLDPKTSSPEDCVPCLFLPYSSARFLIFYLHSNAEDLGRCHNFCSSIRAQFQVHVFAVEYPGYGICPGGPCNEQRVTENAFVAFRFVREVMSWPLDSILILGRSIGCGPAISLGVRYTVSGLIVVSPMLSVKELIKDALGPLAYLMEERFPNKDRVPFVRSPFLVIHGQKDMMIPCKHGVELYGVCRSRKLLVCPKDMEHNTSLLANVTYFVLPMLQFFSLPDYCFEDIHVPRWAYDKRLSPFFSERGNAGALTKTAHLLGSGVLKEDTCETPTQPTMGCFICPPLNTINHDVHGPLEDVRREDAPSAPFQRWFFGQRTTLGKDKRPWAVAPGPRSGLLDPPVNSRVIRPSMSNASASTATRAPIGPRVCAAPGKPTEKAEYASTPLNGSPPVNGMLQNGYGLRVAPPGAWAHQGQATTNPPPVRRAPSSLASGGGPRMAVSSVLQPPKDDSIVSPRPPDRVTVKAAEKVEPQQAQGRRVCRTTSVESMERTASRNRFEGVAKASPRSNTASQAPKEADAPVSPSPRTPSPSERLKLLTPADLVEMVEDLERHFNAEARQAPVAGPTSRRAPATQKVSHRQPGFVPPPPTPILQNRSI